MKKRKQKPCEVCGQPKGKVHTCEDIAYRSNLTWHETCVHCTSPEAAESCCAVMLVVGLLTALTVIIFG